MDILSLYLSISMLKNLSCERCAANCGLWFLLPSVSILATRADEGYMLFVCREFSSATRSRSDKFGLVALFRHKRVCIACAMIIRIDIFRG